MQLALSLPPRYEAAGLPGACPAGTAFESIRKHEAAARRADGHEGGSLFED